MDKKKLVTVAWKKCCKSLKEGGLGIKSLKSFNEAKNLHLCWNFFNQNHGWSKLLASRVLRNRSTIAYRLKSSIWSSVRSCFDTILENTQWIIGNGSMVNCWLDN